jgi:LacI family transcriptional regulator
MKNFAPRPTVYDIARTAGVSLATVDRVLNARPGVSEKTIIRVNKAILNLGYVRDVAAANLARQRNYRLAFVVPDEPSAITGKLTEAIEEAGAHAISERTEIAIHTVPDNDPHHLAKTLKGLGNSNLDGVAIMAPETPHVRDAIRRLKENDIHVVAVLSDLPNSQRNHFVGINSVSAGRTAAQLLGRFIGDPPANFAAKILVIAGSMTLRDHIERRLGFDQVMAADFPHVEVLPSVECWDDSDTVRQIVPEMLQRHATIAGIYSLGAGNQGLIAALEKYQSRRPVFVVAQELTAHTRDALARGIFDAVISQDFGHVVRSAIRILRAISDNLEVNPSQERIRTEIIMKENLP